MGSMSMVVRSLSTSDSGAGLTSNSDVYDVGDSVEVHSLLKVTGLSTGTLTITGQHSIDGHYWSALSGLAFSTVTSAPNIQTATASTPAFRFVRFQYTQSTTATVTFELHLFVKTRA